MLLNTIDNYKQKMKFKILAWVVLPDHFHMIIDPVNNNLSEIIQRIKMSFASHYRKENNIKSGRIWQNRFWDHILRDQRDMNHHINYIHYNPVKHLEIINPAEWKYSSIHKYLRDGLYAPNWCKIADEIEKYEYGE